MDGKMSGAITATLPSAKPITDQLCFDRSADQMNIFFEINFQAKRKFVTKTPSKMDVAPWDKHWIKRELDSFGLYSMVFVEIQ